MNKLFFVAALSLGAVACQERPCAITTPSPSPQPSSRDVAAVENRAPVDWQTDFERSGGTATPRYAETIAYCQRLADASPWVSFTRFGTSPQGRDLPLVIVDRNGNFTPAAVRKSGNVVLLVQACIHAGEVEGKDAGLMLIRDMAINQELSCLLDHVTILFIPILNTDGHERFGPFNRINQNGPKEMGWRTTARNLNLNRDFMKADTAEMQAWLQLFTAWLPDFFVDIHSTDGADYQYPLTYGLELFGNLDPEVTAWTKAYLQKATERMADAGMPIAPYVAFKNWDDPRSGLEAAVSGPRFSTGYVALQNRPGLLIETHMLKDYATRVRAAYEMLRQTLLLLNETHGELQVAVTQADARCASPQFRVSPLPVEFKATEKSTTVDFLGFEYEVVKSDLTGGDWVKYSDKPVTFRIAYYNDIVPSLTVTLPLAYLIPPEWDDVIARLALHGVVISRLSRETTVKVRTYRFKDIGFNPGGSSENRSGPYEGRQMCRFDSETIVEERTFPAGTAIVDTAQRAARVIAHFLEPQAPDSFVRWGFFNSIFQETEYAESYVIEKMARQMLAKDPALAEAFAKAKEQSNELRTDPSAIRNWFYQRTPYFDKRLNVYPVGMIDDDATRRALQ